MIHKMMELSQPLRLESKELRESTELGSQQTTWPVRYACDGTLAVCCDPAV